MNELAELFERNRSDLRAVAYRMLGSLTEADDAVQEAWLRLSRSEPDAIDNLGAWLTTVVARVCLDMLRRRKFRQEVPIDEVSALSTTRSPDEEAVIAESVGLAMLVVLEALSPVERVSFVLHDMFALPFDEIAPILGSTPAGARQAASRGRRRVQGAAGSSPRRPADVAGQRKVVDAFLAAARAGNFEGLVAVLHPDVRLRADRAAVPRGVALAVQGASNVARRAIVGARPGAEVALVNGSPGVIVAPKGQLELVLAFVVNNGRIVEMEVIGEPSRLREVDIQPVV